MRRMRPSPPPSRRGLIRGGALLTLFGGSRLLGCAPGGSGPTKVPATAGLTTARADGFRMPAEWDPHDQCLMAFPTPQNWVGCYDGSCNWIDQARADWAAVANAVAEFEPVTMIVNEGESSIAAPLLSSGITIVELPINDAWTRDTGPLFLTDGKGGLRAACFTFNCWGEKYTPYDDDAALKGRLCDSMGVAQYLSALIAEGGAVTVDGEGTVITTESVLLNADRNPGWSKEQVEAALEDMLGVSHVVWLAQGTVPDPITDGHVDGICAFVAPGVVMLHTTTDTTDPNYAVCEEARQRLLAATDASGRALEIIELPLGTTLAHINFYLPNGGVVAPLSGIAAEDEPVLSILRDTFPDRTVVGVEGPGLTEGGGGVHCITQQVPRV